MLPQEYAVRRILPQLRGLLAHKLRTKGLSQQRIADLLLVSQPMVNKYLRISQEKYLNALLEEGVPKDLIDLVVNDMVAMAERNHDLRLGLVNALNLLTINSDICKEDYWRPDLCKEVFCISFKPEVRLLKSVIDEIVHTKGFELIVPEVGSNIVYDPLRTKDPRRMIAVDGRIVRGTRGVYIAGEVKVGGSKHTAKILASLEELCPEVHVVLVIANNRSVSEAIRRCKLSFIETGPHVPGSSVEDEISRALGVVRDVCKLDIILDRGGEGLEPVSYLIAKDLDELVNKLRCIISGAIK